MQSNNLIIEMGNKLPRGSKKEMSTKLGLSQKTVVDFFKGRTPDSKHRLDLIREAINLLDAENKLKIQMKAILG